MVKRNNIGKLLDDLKIFKKIKTRDENWHMVVMDDGGVYTGNLKSGKRHGYGSHKYADGTFYTGQWEDDEPHGEGRSYASCKQISKEGRFEHGEFVQGVIDMVNGRYEGRLKNGKFHGEGILETDDLFYEGTFCNGKCHGEGVLETIKNGKRTKYDGEFYKGKRHGYGVQQDASGIYEGDWDYGRRSGGIMTDSDDQTWEVEFDDNGKIVHMSQKTLDTDLRDTFASMNLDRGPSPAEPEEPRPTSAANGKRIGEASHPGPPRIFFHEKIIQKVKWMTIFN